MDLNGFDFGKMPAFVMISMMPTFGTGVIDETLSYESVQKFLKSKEKFDVCIVEIFYMETYMVSSSFGVTHHLEGGGVIYGVKPKNLTPFVNNPKNVIILNSQAMAEHFDCILIGYTTFNAVGTIDEITGK